MVGSRRNCLPLQHKLLKSAAVKNNSSEYGYDCVHQRIRRTSVKSYSQAQKRTLSQSLADTAVTAAGHALDNLSDWLEKSAPIEQSARQKLERAASLTPQIAAKIEQQVTKINPFQNLHLLFCVEFSQFKILRCLFKQFCQEMDGSEDGLFISKLAKQKVPKDPLISPLYASPEALRQLPPVWFVVSPNFVQFFSKHLLKISNLFLHFYIVFFACHRVKQS